MTHPSVTLRQAECGALLCGRNVRAADRDVCRQSAWYVKHPKAGLSTGISSCLDERAVPPQQQVRLVRGFYRNVDAAELESRLRERTFSTTTTPLPLEHGAAAVHVPEPAAACDAMVEARMLTLRDIQQRRRGALTMISRRLGPNLKVGVGYNFTDFSDDLTDLRYNHRGVFINIVGIK